MKLWLTAWLALMASFALAQTDPTSAEAYFNQGSATFIREEPEQALVIVNEGLALHPENEPLIKLKALLEQQKDQNQQDQQNQQNQEDRKDQQEQQDQSQKDEEPQQDQEEQKEDEPEKEEQEQDQPEAQPPEEEQPQDEQPSPGEMTEEEAEMVLDSLRQLEQAQREQMTREMIRKQMSDMPPVEKDW